MAIRRAAERIFHQHQGGRYDEAFVVTEGHELEGRSADKFGGQRALDDLSRDEHGLCIVILLCESPYWN